MNNSFLFFLIPIIFLKIPTNKIVSLLLLTITTYMYHNQKKDSDIDFLRFLDQNAIIHTTCILTFNSIYVSIFFLSLYLFEQIFFQTQIIPCLVFFLCSLKYIHNKFCFFFFCCSTYIYLYLTYHQIQYFNYYDRYLWHFVNIMYITIGLSLYHPKRFGMNIIFSKKQK